MIQDITLTTGHGAKAHCLWRSPWLAVTEAWVITGYVITHRGTGLTLASVVFMHAIDAREAAKAIQPWVDWRKPKASLQADLLRIGSLLAGILEEFDVVQP